MKLNLRTVSDNLIIVIFAVAVFVWLWLAALEHEQSVKHRAEQHREGSAS